MTRKSTRTFRMYIKLLRRDIKLSTRKLVHTKRTRGQFVLTFTRPSFKTSKRYFMQWRKSRKVEAPLRRNVAVAYLLLIIGCGAMVHGLIQLTGMQPSVPQVAAA